MATARDDLQEVTGKEVFKPSTIGEALAELGTDPQKYEGIYQLRLQRPTEYEEKVLPSLSPLERNTLGLLQAGYSSGASPEEFLSRLGPYMDYGVDLNSLIANPRIPPDSLGYVSPSEHPFRAVMFPPTLLRSDPEANTLLHELEHVSQFKTGAFDQSSRPEILQEQDQALLERAKQLRAESAPDSPLRRSVLSAGNVLTTPQEVQANISAAAQIEAARGRDFIQSPEGQALFPTPEDRAYYYGAIMPGVPSAYPSQGTFVPEERPAARDKSYARQMFEMLPKFQEGGEVLPPKADYLFPDRARDYVAPKQTSSAVDLARLGKQAGLVGLGFAPGAGVADYFGQFPSMEGGMEPSAVENFRQGNYGTAAMQGLGAMGDLAMTIPVAGAAIGSVMKAPRAIQRGMTASDALKKLPKVSEQGFYSQVEKAILDNPQQKGSGQQFLAQLQKTPGVKPEEIQYTGLDTFLANKPTVTKTEIQDFLDTSKVQLQEVTLGSKQSIANRDEAIASRYGYEAIVDDNGVAFFDPNLDDFVEFRDLPAAMRAEISNPQTEFGGVAKFGTYTLPGGENYREVLLTLPEKTPANFPDFDSYFNERYLNSSNGYTTPEAIAYARQDAMRNWKNSGEQIPMSDASAGNYTSSHFDQSNILAHMRLNDRVIDGKPTLFIEEIQSDWHQAGRKKGYDTPEARAAEQQKLDTIVANRQSLLDEKTRLEQLAEPYTSQGKDAPSEIVDRWSAISNQLNDLERQSDRLGSNFGDFVPDAPFKTTWDELTLKRAIKMASDEGYDKIAFTTGKTQAARYDLSKQIQKIIYGQPDENGLRRVEAITPTGDKLLGKKYSISEIEDNVGKEVAEKITKSVGVFDERTGTYSMGGVDLEIGGEGMKGFYDKMLPKKLEKMGKKYGVKPTKSNMDTPKGPVEVWTMDIPDEMSEVISSQGQPLFQIGAGAGLGAAGIMGLTPGEAEAK